MPVRRRVLLALVVAAFVSGCGSEGGAPSATTHPPVAASTTTAVAAPTTTAPARPSLAAQPKIASEAIEFLDCDTLTKKGAWWTCRRHGGVAYIIEGGTAQSVYDQVRKRSDYNESVSTLHESDGGFIYLPGLDGFEHVYTHVGPRPGMRVVDTDLLS
jgi:hypothetical protein